ncbi:EAL domain-containing protein [Cellulomonas fimi]|uniref:EAL domain-containing protein n=1 Tax=Cellulomonas fimi TaxID=1708 RepID=A0A7Y0QHR6_CELFI|nr:EAL domain-containing protein [Cellulomonas fimi]NMR20174.1 EAL domain-containing protein [Cellulomonas fimi]
MGGAVDVVAVVAQCVTAGFIAGLSFQNWTGWRADAADRERFWLMVWSAVLALLFLVNAVLPLLPAGSATEVGLFARSMVLAGSILLSVPALKVVTRGPTSRWLVLVVGGMFLTREVLWLTTDLLYTHRSVDGVPQYGPLLTTTFMVPLAVVAGYAVISIRRIPSRLTRRGLQLAGALSTIALVAGYFVPGGRFAELLTSVWALPLVAAIQAVGVLRQRAAERRVRRQHRMRDELAALGNAAWFTKDPYALLALAEKSAREQLRDPQIVGYLRPLSRGRFSTTLDSPTDHLGDDLARDFLDDLCRLVSVAAERSRLAEELRGAAFTDSLTGLPNRHALERHLGQTLERARDQGTRLAVLYCDIDGFKLENDQRGHTWGDELLRRTGAYLTETIDERHFVARFGGDEFVVVLEDAPQGRDLVALGRRIRGGLDLTGTDQIAPLLSVGVAVWSPDEIVDPERLLREADTAMFEAKRSKLGVVEFDDALRAKMLAEQNLRRELDAAIANHEFRLHFQPIVDAETLTIVGLEALVRWQHPAGTRMPGDWLPYAEESGLIVPIGRQLVLQAHAAVERFRLPVAVNVAARQLAEPGFVEQLRQDWGDGDWNKLTLEITESALLQDLAHVIDSLSQLRALGARIAIDDFGTGYSSFARLATLPVDVLKIDRAFVRDLSALGGVAVVRAIVSLAEAFELDIVAEGVERLDQLQALTELGVPKLQGYLLGRPGADAPREIDLATVSAGNVPPLAASRLTRAAPV